MLLIFHVSVLSWYLYTIWYDQQYVDIKFPAKEFEHIPFKARAIFFTFWSMVLQTVYFLIATLNDVIGTNEVTKNPPFIRKLKDVLFSFTLTTAFYVVLVFWAFYSIDKTMIIPNDEAENQIPRWINHTLHTLILPIMFVELLVTKRNYPSRQTGFSIAIWVTAIYAAYIHFVYFKYGIWPYPFLYVVSWATKFLYFVCSAVFGVSFYVIGEKLDSYVSKNTKISHANGTKKIH